MIQRFFERENMFLLMLLWVSLQAFFYEYVRKEPKINEWRIEEVTINKYTSTYSNPFFNQSVDWFHVKQCAAKTR